MITRRRYLKPLLSGALVGLLALVLLPLYVGCGKKAEEGTEDAFTQDVPIEEEAVPEDSVWEPVRSKGATELLSRMDYGRMLAEEAKAFVPDDLDEVQARFAAGDYDVLFTQGNQDYRDSSYRDALQCYDTILADFPTHLGANNNRTLALLQLEKNEDAFDQSVKTMALYPVESGCLLNFQICAAREGFDSQAVTTALEQHHDSVSDDSETTFFESLEMSYEMVESYRYNEVVQDIEFLPEPLPNGANMTLEEYLRELSVRLDTNGLMGRGDPDIRALNRYLNGLTVLERKQQAATTPTP
ncbi:MAG: hypothetical protein LBH64_03615 [Coriobacteriales bacterium]|jgi:hypothetical protein|nr:hypothetical protein [Coriobacteriales bacterium]